MVLFEVGKTGLKSILEIVKGANNGNKSFILESLLKAVHIPLIQVSDGVGNKDYYIVLRIFL